jgi:TolB-like protein/class 3 adenylate cyclase/Flp pilus assembly protein TadD
VAAGTANRRLAAILSADVVGYSRLMAEDEAATVRALTAYREQIATLVREHRGRVVDAPGDNVLAEFPSALDAVHAAVEIQRVIQARNADLPAERRMEFRIGVHMGDVVVEGERIYGDGVNIAARLEGLAEPGGICISGTVQEQVANKLELQFEDLGEQTVKNIPKPVRVYQLGPMTISPMREKRRIPRTRRTSLVTAGLVLVLALTVVAVWLIRPHDPLREVALEQEAMLALPTGPTVAVLPFTNLSGDPEQEYFSDGLTDDIITALSRFRDLFVIARNSTFRYKGKSVDVRELNRDLGARYVVEGSVRRARARLRVTVQLLDAKDGTHLWADTYDRDLSAVDIFAVQDEITEQVVGAISGNYGVISRARFAKIKEKPTDNLDAYECVLRVGAYYRDNYVAPEHAKVRDCLERAVKSDPGYATAWASLASLYTDEHRFNHNPRPDPLGRALDAAQRAIDADPTSQDAHNALAQAYFHRHELDPFLAETERALALNPNNADVLAQLGDKLQIVDDPRGILLVRKAMKLDPFHPTWFNLPIAAHHFDKGEYEEALVAARKINIPGSFWPQIHLAAIYGELGRLSEARSAVEELLRIYPGFTTETYVEEAEKWNVPKDRIPRWREALRKAGVPE